MNTRRAFLKSGLGLALASAATGLAPRWIRDGIVPDATAAPPAGATFVILATSMGGDPMNVSVPGSYTSPAINRPADAAFDAADITLGNKTVKGAAMWGTLPSGLLSRLAFVHHKTFAVAHSEYDRVMRLQDAIKGASGNSVEMLPSTLAQELAPSLGTLQTDPICLGPERMTIGGGPLSPLKPSGLKALFSGSISTLDNLKALRDAHVDKMYANLKASGTRAQKAFFDDYVLSRERSREIGQNLSTLLAALPLDPNDVDGPDDQVVAAVALAKLNVTPVITVHLPFGGDNHSDSGFANELEESVDSMGTMSLLWNTLVQQGLTDKVTFAIYNMFGRTLDSNNGRSHNPDHNVMAMFGPNLVGGVAGGLDDKLAASDFDPATGAVGAGAGVGVQDSAAAAGATLLVAAGVSAERAAVRIPTGKVVSALLAT